MSGEQREIGEYQLECLISQGGMGEVYRARHRKLARVVAIKVLRENQADLEQRFVLEACVLAEAQHPGLVTVFEFGHSEAFAGRPYLVMEFLDGDTLRHRLDELRRLGGHMDRRLALRLAQQLAASLAYAHDRGIIHRDLKPENVMVIADPEHPDRERAKLIDFGLSKRLPELSPGEEAGGAKTREGMLLGTPLYMAPEVWQGAKDATSKADVYALGLIFYELFAGTFPFSLSKPTDLQELLWHHLTSTPPPLRDVTAAVPMRLSALIQAMLHKDPKQRPSMQHVDQALARLLDEDKSQRQGPALSLSKSPLVSFCLGLAVCATGFAGWRLWPSRGARSNITPTPPAPLREPEHAATPPGVRREDEGASAWVPVASGTRQNLYAVWGVLPTDVWAVGGAILHWDGERWSNRESDVDVGASDAPKDAGRPQHPDLRGLWGASSRDVWAVGKHGIILHWDGERWSKVESSSTENLYAVWGSGPKDVWVVGDAGTMLHYDGRAFSIAPRVTWHALRGIWGSGSTDIWAVGSSSANDGVLLRSDGGGFRVENQPIRLNAIWGSGPHDVWIVGGTKDNQGRIYHSDGQRLTEVPVGSTEWLQTVFGAGPAEVWVAGDHDVLLHYDGANFWPMRTGSRAMFRAVWESTPQEVWAVATDGQIFRFNRR